MAWLWQVVSEASDGEGSISTWHLSPNYQVTVSSLVIVTGCLGSHVKLVFDCALPGWAWGHLLVRFLGKKETTILGRMRHGTSVA